jgi:uncharacterized DUF497 family protein
VLAPPLSRRQADACGRGEPAHVHDEILDTQRLLSYTICVRFVWDPRKAAANLRKHGVSFEEAATAFDDQLGAYYPDALYENRFILIAYSRVQRLLYVVHAEVQTDTIRIISARKATKHEKARYEND